MNVTTNKPSLPKNVFELAAEERQFLHDLANPLAAAAGLVEAYRDELARSETNLSEPLERKLTKLEAAIERIGALLAERRPRLIAIQDAAPPKV